MADRKGRGTTEARVRRQQAAADRRRQVRRDQAQPATSDAALGRSSESRRRRPGLRIAAALAVVGILGVAVVGIFRSSGSSNSKTSTQLTGLLISPTGGPLAIATPPTSYRIVYAVESYDDAGKATTSTEEVNVRRPFDGHISSKAGAPPGGASQWDLVNVLGSISDTTTGSTADVTRVPPGSPAGDIRVDATLADLLDQHMFVPRERRQLLGRECQVYRTGQPLESAQVSPPTDSDYADACIDASGLMLEEVSVAAGKLALRTQAVEVNEAPQFPDSLFSVQGTPTPVGQGGAELIQIDAATSPIAGFWQLPSPSGYQHVGRYLLRVPNPTAASAASTTTNPGGAPAAPSTTTPTAPPLESYVDVFSGGADFLVVQQGVSASEPQSQSGQGTEVDVGKLGKGQFNPGVTGNALLLHPAAGWFVSLQGTLSSAALTQLSGTLSPAG